LKVPDDPIAFNFIVRIAQSPLKLPRMIRVLLLLIEPSRTWEKIKNDQPSVARVSWSCLLPVLLLASAGEALGLVYLGVERGTVTQRVVKVSQALALRYELTQIVFSLVIVYLGAVALKGIGASFHRRHSYTQCFTMLAYSLSPLFLLRLLDAVPAVSTWVCYSIGILLALSFLYRGIPFVMQPDPSNALGLFLFCSVLLMGATGLAHFLAVLVLDEKILV
jgi:hypothetical protein